MTIVHFGPAALPIPHRTGGAIQRRMLEIAKMQASRGHCVIIYSADESSAEVEWCGVRIRSISCAKTSRYFRDMEYLRKALYDMRNQTADVFHFHSLPEGAALSGKMSCTKFLSYDYFVFRRGKKTPLFWWYRNALRKFTCLLPVSEYCCYGSRLYWNLESVPIRVVHNGVNLEQFRPDPAQGTAKKRALNLEGTRIVLYVGRVCEQKGTDVLIDAYLKLKQECSDVRLVVTGPPGKFGELGETALTRRISESGGLYLGAVHEQDLASIYNIADVFVMPTREIEMFGMAAVEAQACGKPVVASQHGALPEVISKRSGRFFPVGDPIALADQLLLLLRDPGLYSSLAEAARENATRFAWPRIADQLEATYSQA